MKKINKIHCNVPVEIEEVGPFKICREDCEYSIFDYQVRCKDGSLIKRFKSLKEAREDANERHAVILKNKYDADTNNIYTDSREV